MSVYSVTMLVIVLLGELLMIIVKGGGVAMDNVYKFASMMRCSAYMISHCGFLFLTLLFHRKILSFLHVLLTFNSSIHNKFISYGISFNFLMAQVFVLVTIHALYSVLLPLSFPSIDFVRACGFLGVTVSIFFIKFSNMVVHKLSCRTERMFYKDKHMFV